LTEKKNILAKCLIRPANTGVL